ncbi:MarR family transcriptional regulator [Williamsia sp. Leaf354]|uniref:MarR family winged helix-turn-helix transcriptional regulator n=1 Tax=Williamsia sp. Leaf354 TaxID=1736349 RepID=UPI0006F6E870|nr:MarR family transcriptional regulator [Williamsia sp. Leaf354]KQR99286.1 MarR family transcriptional regulator [Williamsia sp. Leaf354]
MHDEATDDGGAALDRTGLESAMASDLRALSAASEQIGRVFAGRHDLSANDFQALLRIMVADVDGEPLTVGKLGSSLGMSSAAMTYLVERMINSEHIRREPDPSDRRRVILRYDDHGMEVAREFFGPLGAVTRAALADLDDSDLATAHRVFGVLIDALRGYARDLGESPS